MLNKVFAVVLIVISFCGGSIGQNQPFKSPLTFISNYDSMPQVLLVGTFHFNYPNLDAHKVKEEDQINIQHANKQEELKELLEYISRFKPTKIVLEAGRNTGYLMNRYRRWQQGEEELKKNETDQIGIRLMHRFNLDTLYGTDAGSMADDLEKIDGGATYVENLFKDYDWKSDDPIDHQIDSWYEYEDGIMNTYRLLDIFKYMNSDEALNLSHGAYLIGDFRLDDYRGADATCLYWYNRNLRIFRNIQMIHPKHGDRLLVLYGAGHIPILKHLFEASPEYKLVKFEELEALK